MKPSAESRILKAIAGLSKSVDERFEDILGVMTSAFREQDEKIDGIKQGQDLILGMLDASAATTKTAESERATNTSAHARFEKRITALEKNRTA